MKTFSLVGFLLMVANAALAMVEGIATSLVAGAFGAEGLVFFVSALAVLHAILSAAACAMIAVGSARANRPAMIAAVLLCGLSLADVVLRILSAMSGFMNIARLAIIALIFLYAAARAALALLLGRGLKPGWKALSFVLGGFLLLAALASLALNIGLLRGELASNIHLVSIISATANVLAFIANGLGIAFYIGCALSLRRPRAAGDPGPDPIVT